MVLLRNIITPLALAAVTVEALPFGLEMRGNLGDLSLLGGRSFFKSSGKRPSISSTSSSSSKGGSGAAPILSPPKSIAAPPKSVAAPPKSAAAPPKSAAAPPASSAKAAPEATAKTESAASAASVVSKASSASAASAATSASAASASSAATASTATASAGTASSGASSASSAVSSASSSASAVPTAPPTTAPVKPVANTGSIPASVTCAAASGPNVYSAAQIQAAIERGQQYVNANVQALKGKNLRAAGFPKTFNNREGVAVDSACTGGSLQEFPILSTGQVLTSQPSDKAPASKNPPGPDRVIFTTAGGVPTFCGLTTHPSLKDNSVQACT